MLHRDQKVEEMRRVPLFSGCSKGELKQIARLADEVDMPAGKVLTEQGTPGREFFILLDGTVDVVRDGNLVDTLGAGDFFGETALLSDRPRNATVTASTPLRTLVISERDFYALLIDTPKIQWKVLRALADRLAPRETV
jgi:cAMP-dependent protein kinase regulator